MWLTRLALRNPVLVLMLSLMTIVIGYTSLRRLSVDLFPDMMVHGFEKTSIEILKALLADDGVHGILFISFAFWWGTSPYQPIVELLQAQRKKPVFFALLGPKEDVEACQDLVEENRLPCYLFPEMGVRAFAHMWHYARRQKEPF